MSCIVEREFSLRVGQVRERKKEREKREGEPLEKRLRFGQEEEEEGKRKERRRKGELR